MNSLKIVYVKSTLYWDLHVCDISSNHFDLLKTTLLRCPPIALKEKLNADFIIIKEPFDKPDTFYNDLMPNILSIKDNIMYNKTNKNPYLNFLDETYHKNISINDVAHDVNTIDWSKYNIVIALNMCIPNSIIKKYPKILWAYMVGENTDSYLNTLYEQYDLALNQNMYSFWNEKLKIVDTNLVLPQHSISFPYSFLHPYTYENLYETKFNKDGIFIELNNTTERPVITVPDNFKIISKYTNIPTYIHNQNILENIKTLLKSKYFIKLNGRLIRGNAVLEAISAGCIIIGNPTLIIYNNLIHPFCCISSENEVIHIIKTLETNTEKYNEILLWQKEMMLEKYYNKPLENLYKRYKDKIDNHII
jgi:hypothetical protein